MSVKPIKFFNSVLVRRMSVSALMTFIPRTQRKLSVFCILLNSPAIRRNGEKLYDGKLKQELNKALAFCLACFIFPLSFYCKFYKKNDMRVSTEEGMFKALTSRFGLYLNIDINILKNAIFL